jgi:hypothetical protein
MALGICQVAFFCNGCLQCEKDVDYLPMARPDAINPLGIRRETGRWVSPLPVLLIVPSEGCDLTP